jgi:hypothetical protein
MNKTGFYPQRLRLIQSIYSIQAEINSIHKELKIIDNLPLKTLIISSKLSGMSEYLKKLTEQIREIHPETQLEPEPKRAI